jgi:uncharacterized protein (UPF0332 family)
MTFDWQEYLTLAENLCTNSHTFPNQDECFRVAISRAYYAAFCTARNYAKDYDHLSLQRTGEDHRIVKDHYISANSSNTQQQRKREQIGINLDRLRNLRNKADYDDIFSRLENEAKYAITLSKKVIHLLEALFEGN